MSGISAENLARLTSSDISRLYAAVEAVLYLADDLEEAAKAGQVSASTGMRARQFRLAVEDKIR
jgi:predicted RNA-binding protein associated with RNAse of E/G family